MKRPPRRVLLGLSNLGFALAALLALLPSGMSTYGRWKQAKEQRMFRQELVSETASAGTEPSSPPPAPDPALTSRGTVRHRTPASAPSTFPPDSPRPADDGPVPPPIRPGPPPAVPAPEPAPGPSTVNPPPEGADPAAEAVPLTNPTPAPRTGPAPEAANPRPATSKKRGISTRRKFKRTRLQIPAIGVDAIVSDMKGDWSNWRLFTGPVREPHSSRPGERGNCVIAAHRNMWDATFADLPRVRPGDRALVTTPYGRYTYRIVSSRMTRTSDLSPLKPSRDPRLTLYTCILPYSSNRRWVVQARLVGSESS